MNHLQVVRTLDQMENIIFPFHKISRRILATAKVHLPGQKKVNRTAEPPSQAIPCARWTRPTRGNVWSAGIRVSKAKFMV